MSESHAGSERLRDRFLNSPRETPPEPGCPSPEAILKAVLGESASAENRALAEHAALCAPCAAAWRLAREYANEAELVPDSGAAGQPSRTLWRWTPAAVALAAVLLFALFLLPRDSTDPVIDPVLRSLGQKAIESALPPDATLPADGFVLRWVPVSEGARYTIRVTDQRLEPLAGASGLQSAEYAVSAEALAGLEPGSLVLWQVETVLGDGRRIVSETFVTRIE